MLKELEFPNRNYMSNREQASKELRALLNAHNLNDWKIRQTTDLSKPFLGMCDAKIKTIILNAHHIDSHPWPEVINTIRHEVAHALTLGHGHDNVWAAKARELGCDNTLPCAPYGFSPAVIDAIRSGAQVEVEFDEEIQVIRKPKYRITRLQDKCPVCGKIAKETSRKLLGSMNLVTLECGHTIFKEVLEKFSKFEDITFDGNPSCKHKWGEGKQRTICTECNAKRLYQYQIEGARALESSNGRMLLCDEMGLGKTIQALAYLKFHPEAYPYLWITKSGIKYQHSREITRILGEELTPQVVNTSNDKLYKAFKGYLTSYDILKKGAIFEQVKEREIKCVVIDECQAIKNPDAARTGAIRQLVRDIPRVIPMSGTPWKNRGSEYYVVLNILDPVLFPSYQKFITEDVDYYYKGEKLIAGGIANPEKFREKVAHIVIRRERSEVMPELPTISRHKFETEVPEHARNAYQAEENKLVDVYNTALLEGTEDSFEVQKQINASLLVMRQIVGIAKIPATVELAKSFLEETDRKLVIFVHHRECARKINDLMSAWAYDEGHRDCKPLALSSDLTPEQRFEVQEKFNGPNHRLLIASTLASGEGLNLQTCSDCIMHERQWNPANEEQAEGRFIRIGQMSSAVVATYVHGADTVDTILDDKVEKKRVAFHNSMNKTTLEAWNEGTLTMDVVKEIVFRRKR